MSEIDPLLSTGGAFSGALWEAFREDVSVESVLRAGDRLGPFEVAGEIGRGGAAVVYLAERADGAFDQTVAIKVLAGAFSSRDALRRLEQERQILASLDHPNIARLIDGGVDGAGRPFIVMEHVDGRPIDRYCDEHGLSVDERVDLFLVVAAAVAHAHQRLIVHRDLKPGNILVTRAGEVKLLDFGIAKLLAPEAAGRFAAPPTRLAVRLMTPEYASPEQVLGGPVTTASDVYQLGLVLYEILAGRRPREIAGDSPAELQHAVCETEIARPSATVGPGKAGLRRRLAGDLDNIVLRALAREPERRYASPAELAADLQRHRSGLPVMARGSSFAYRAGKLVRRHRWAAAAAAASLLSLLVGLGVAVGQARAARQEADKASAVKAFLARILVSADPSVEHDRDVTARELLDRSVGQIDALAGQPQVQAELLAVAGISYRSLGLYPSARPLLSRSLALARELHGPRSLEAAEGEFSLAVLHMNERELDPAEALLRSALATRRSLLPPGDPRIADCLAELGIVHVAQDRDALAEPLLAEALALRRASSGPSHPQVAVILDHQAMLRHRAGDLDAAERLYREALAVHRRARGLEHPEVATALHNLGALLWRKRDLAEAESLFRQVIVMKARFYKGRHPSLADNWGYLGHVLRDQGDARGAEQAYRRSLDINRALRRKGHPATVSAAFNLGRLFAEVGRCTEAGPLLEEARAGLGPAHRKTLEAVKLLAGCRTASRAH